MKLHRQPKTPIDRYPSLSSVSVVVLCRPSLARSSSRLGHGPLKAGARVRVPYALPTVVTLWSPRSYDLPDCSEGAEIVT